MTIYLYKKTHNKTGMQYLGKTSQPDPHKYKGSGLYWSNHIRKHGYDVRTEILQECTDLAEVKQWGKYYSELWGIVESNKWANMKPEEGDGAPSGNYNHCKRIEVQQKISATMRGRPAHNKGKKQLHKKHASRKDYGLGYTSVGSNGKLKGRVRPRTNCPHCGKSVDEANFHRYHGAKCKLLN